MENTGSGNLTKEDRHNNTIDLDYSLNDLFETDWNNVIKNNVSRKDSQGKLKFKVAENSDPDYTLNDCFNLEWTYDDDSTKAKKMSISPESVMEIMRFKTKSDFIKLLDSDYELNVLNEKDQTALHLLFHWKNWEYFDVLDKKFSSYPIESRNVNFIDRDGLAHLHIACAKGSLSLVSRYLYNNDNINASYKGDSHANFTALHFAMMNPKNDKKEIVKKLIEHGANVNAIDTRDRTPFHIASRIFEKRNDVESDGRTNVEVMDILLRSQSNIEAKDKDGNTPLLSVFSPYYEEFQIDYHGYSINDDLFHLSVYMREVKEKLKFFLRHGADVTATKNKNENILHLILNNLKKYRHQFRNANYIFDDSDHLDMIKQIFVVDSKIDLNLKNDKGETPLQMSVACMSTRVVELLLDHGADLKGLKFEHEDQEEFFCYPDMVVLFEPMQDLTNVLDLLSSRGFNLSLRDNTAILQLLLHENKGDDYPLCDCEIYPYNNVKFVLQYGSKSHIENVLNRLYHGFDLYEGPGNPNCLDVYNDERLAGTQELYSDLMEYLDTTRIGNIYSDEDIKKIVTDINEHMLSGFDPIFNHRKYMKQDLSRLKSIMFDNNVSLHNVLQKDPLDTPHSIANGFSLQLIENLHCYKDTVKGHITKARVRCFFEKYSSDYLKLICNTLSDACCKMIVYHLSNEDILNLCLATVE